MKPFAPKEQFLQNSAKVLDELYTKMEKLENLYLNDLTPSKTMAISVDMNNGFAKNGALYSERVRDLIEPTAQFFAACRDRGIQLLALSDKHSPDSSEIESYPKHCLENTPECEVVDELACLVPTVIYKNSTNSLFAGGDAILSTNTENFIITGCCTDICIYQLAITLRAWLNEQNRSGSVIVPLNLIDTYNAPWHNAELLNMVFAESMLSNGIVLVQQIEF